MKQNEWFVNTFLPSLEKKMTNPKYPGECIISMKQADICMRYMESKYCRGDYGGFYNYYITANGKVYGLYPRGKYYFLSCHHV